MSRPTPDPIDLREYEIRVRGHLDRHWTATFGGLSIRPEPDGTTVISGVVADQAALHGLLQQVRDLGLPLISVAPRSIDLPEPAGSDAGELPRPRRSR